MRKILLLATLLLVTSHFFPARAQFVGYYSPQTIAVRVFNAASAPATFVVPNIGQSIHAVNYALTGSCNGVLDIRIEASSDGTNFFAISTDASDAPVTLQGVGLPNSGGVTAVGYFPVVRVNLAKYTCTGGITITVFYSGTSTSVPPSISSFQQAAPYRQIVTMAIDTTVALPASSVTVPTPFGSTGGSLWLQCHNAAGAAAACPAGGSITVAPSPSDSPAAMQGSGPSSTFTVAGNSTLQRFDVPSFPANRVFITAVPTGGGGGVFWTIYYNFLPVSFSTTATSTSVQNVQQAGTPTNSETTSAANASLTVSIGAVGKITLLYSVAIRSSAGTCSLTIQETISGVPTNKWSSDSAFVGTSTKTVTWPVPYTTAQGNLLSVIVGACGVGNTSTVDIQASTL